MEPSADRSFAEAHAISPMRGQLYRAWLALGLAGRLKARRLRAIDRALGGGLLSDGPAGEVARVLEIGSGSGKDMIRFLAGRRLDIHGVDLFDTGFRQENFTFHLADAAALPFEDRSFDMVVSIGVLEHVTPIAKLDQVTREIARVARRYCVVVPSVGTRIEPHFWTPYWQLRLHEGNPGTHYYADHTWRQFEGFRTARIERRAYLPGLVSNLLISGGHEG